jgi:hypothetical protein
MTPFSLLKCVQTCQLRVRKKGVTLMLNSYKKIEMKNPILSLLMLCFVINAYSQIEIAGVEYTNFLASKITDAANSQEVAIQEYSAFLNLPKKLKNGKTTIINSLAYGQGRISLNNTRLPDNGEDVGTVHTISYSLTLVQHLNEKWNLLFRFRPTIASDLEADLSSDDFLYLGTAMATRKLGQNMVLGGGVVYTTQTGEPLVLPVIKFQHKNQRHDLDILLPSHAKYLHGIGPRKNISLGGQVQLNGGNFNLNHFGNGTSGLTVFDELIYSRTNAGLLAKMRIYRVIQLELFGGYTVARTFKFGTGDNRVGFDVDNGPFFSVGVSFAPQPHGENAGK